MLFDGLDYPTKTMIESLCNGSFTSTTANDAWQFFEVVAENSLEWEPVDVKQPTTTTTTTNKGGMHRVNSNFENNAKMASVVRRLAQSSAPELSKPVVSLVCVLCDSQDHLVEQCPGCQLSKRSKQMYSIHFTSPIPTTTHLVKHTIRNGGFIPTFH